jgi:cephalosporin-C deacetylase
MHCACALFDPCVTPPGQFAIYNALPNQKQLYVLDAGHHHYQNQLHQQNELLNELTIFFESIG